MNNVPGKSYLLVFTNAIQGREAEFNDWYTNTHIHEVAAIDGVVSAQRFELCETQMNEDQKYKYTAIYELENGREAEALANLQAAVPGMKMTTSADLDNAHSMILRSISELA